MRVHTPLAYGTQADPNKMAPEPRLSQSKSVRQLKPISFEAPLGNIAEYDSLSRRISAADFPLEPHAFGLESQPQCLSDRSHTLKIFKHKSRQIRQINNIAATTTNKKRGDDQIKPTDSLRTVNAIVQMRKTEYEQKKKAALKGSMYVNDLWGQDYEKNVMINAMLRRQLNKQKSTIRTTTPGTQIQNFMSVKPEIPKIPLTQTAEVKDNKYYMSNYTQFDSPRTENSDYYSTNNTAWMTEMSNSQPRKSFRIKTEHSPQSNKSPSNISTAFGGSPKYTKNFGTPKSSPRSPHLWAGSHSAGLKKMSDDEELDPSKRQRQPSRGLVALDTKMFIGRKNHEFNNLMEHCDNELQEKQNWCFMMNNLEELFVNAKYDKKKKMEVNQKAELRDNFKFLFSKKGRSVKNQS